MTQTYKIANGDIVFDASTGRPHMISDQEKLRQDIDHYTTNSVVNVIGRIDSIEGLRAEVSTRLRAALSGLQSAQEQGQRRDRTNGERLGSIRKILVGPVSRGNKQVKTMVTYVIEVLSAAGLEKAPVSLTKSIQG